MNLEQARKIGMEVVEALAPACDRIVIAGSVRRGKPTPKDIEIIYVPRLIPTRIDLFTTNHIPATGALVEDLVRRHFWQFDDQVKRNGPCYKRMVRYTIPPITSIQDWSNDDEERIVIELFCADRDNWGYILALRTGPGEFNKIWAAKPWNMGCLPSDVALKDGYLWRRGRPVPIPTEEEFFAQIGIPCWPPAERSAIHLAQFLLERRARSGKPHTET